jgi:hypothetical protein
MLPVKKRKIEHEKVDPNSTHVSKKWVGFCTLQHKQDILNNQYLCSDVIISAQNLLQIQFPNINGFQETTLAPVFSNGKWTSSTGFQAQDPPCVQIHHNGRDHWVLSIQIENGDIYFLDSLRLKINTSLEFQLCKMYGQNNNRILIKIPEVQKQDNSIDCGLFAIANAVEFCNNGFKGGTHINYDEKYMRDHLIYCLERGFFSQFPKNRIGRVPKF